MVTTTRLYIQLANYIIEDIRNERFKVGERLPSERDLSTMFEVSRSTVREALIVLELNEIVDIRQGCGVIIKSFPHSSISSGDDITPEELLEARETLEPNIARLAALKATPEDLIELEQIHQSMEAALQLGTEALREAVSVDADTRFHVKLAMMAHNPLLMEMIEKVWAKGTRGDLWLRYDYHAHASIYRQLWVNDHKAILEAVKSGDEKATYNAALNHLNNVREAVTKFEME